MQLGMLLRKVGLAKNVTGNIQTAPLCDRSASVSVLYRWPYVVLFLHKDTFLGCFCSKVAGKQSKFKKKFKNRCIFCKFYVYFFRMNLMGIKKMGEKGLKMTRLILLPPPCKI